MILSSGGEDQIKVYKDGRVDVVRGEVTATVDPRLEGMKRWRVISKKPYRVYYGPFLRGDPDFVENGHPDECRSITTADGLLFAYVVETEGDKDQDGEKNAGASFYCG
jgi:hypothetical protein